MEVFIEVYTKGGRPRIIATVDEYMKTTKLALSGLNPRKFPDLSKPHPNLKYYHLWIADDDGLHTEEDLWDLIHSVIREMEKGKGRCVQNRFPNFMEFKDY